MDIPGENPTRETVRCCFEDLYGPKVGTYHWKLIMGIQEYELEYDDGTHDG